MSSFLDRRERRLVVALDGTGEPARMGKVVADDDRCTGCNLCVETCPGNALQLRNGKEVRMIDAAVVPCISCGDCVAICQPNALTLERGHVYPGFFKPLHRSATLTFPRKF